MRKIKVFVLSKIYIFYLWLLSKTCKVRIINEDNVDINNSVIGFWHGDSFPMYLLMGGWDDMNISAITTSDSRGDYIDAIMKKCNIMPIRVANGASARHGLQDAIKICQGDKELSLCCAIDGPLGPYHEPKKMAFYICNKSNKKFIGIRAEISKKIIISQRWDKYTIPLPFCTMKYILHSFGEISKEDLKDYDCLSQKVTSFLEGR